MRILVIGGTYFLGKAFVEIASKENEVVLLNRGTRNVTFSYPGHIDYIKCDRREINKVAKENSLLKGKYDVVVDFCAYEKGDITSVVNALHENIGQYIFVSTVDVYRRGTGMCIDESGQLENRDFGGEAGAYILGKASLEEELILVCKEYGIHYNSIRPAFIYGPDNYANRESIFFNWIEQAGQVLNPVVATGSFYMVHVDDVATCLLKICGNKECADKSFNICGNEKITYEKFFDSLSKAVKRDFTKVDISVEEINTRQIPLPFPLIQEESESYSSKYAELLDMTYMSLDEGLSSTYQKRLEQDIMPRIDEFFDNNDPKGALEYMLSMRNVAAFYGNKSMDLLLLNELIGYYRQTSEKEKLLKVIDEALVLSDSIEPKDMLKCATTFLNCANAYRSLGMLDEAKKYYDVTKKIYDEQIKLGRLKKNDLLVAGLFNNMSLLCQELGDFIAAKEKLLVALEIVTELNAGFEIAVTYANLANTCVLGKEYENAKEYAYTAINLFKARGLRDAHYCAALSALGTCYYEEGEVARAAALYKEAMHIVENTIGRNSQYERLRENLSRCGATEIEGKPLLAESSSHFSSKNKEVKPLLAESSSHFSSKNKEVKPLLAENSSHFSSKNKEVYMNMTKMSGLELSRKYYETYGAPMIASKFPEYVGKIAVGLVGKGSDCFGYDDELSADHDYGPDFCMWLSDETYDAIGSDLAKAYSELPDTFEGYKRNVTFGAGRRGVLRISDFYKKMLGTCVYEDIDFSSVEDYALANCTNGEVFRDDEGMFSEMRNKLMMGYPASVMYLKVASSAASFSQCAQYNYLRMLKRGDETTAFMMLSDGIKHALKLWHYVNNVYPPHDKWLTKSARKIVGGEDLILLIEKITGQFMSKLDKSEVTGAIEELADFLVRRMYEKNIVSDLNPYLDYHTEEILFKASIVDASPKELVDRIARLEFDAFDKVKNEGGRASCQDDWPTFSIMRKSQYLTWNMDMLVQYLYDFTRELKIGHNLITEKYGRMMESTAHDKWEEIKDNFPVISEEKKAIIEQIVGLQIQMVEEFALEHPKMAGNARSLHTYEDNMFNTSYETYLRGEISTYSDKMLQLYGGYVVRAVQGGVNIAYVTMENTARFYGYKSIEEYELKE